ncbi:MAG: PAS domain-containing protein [Pseudomonadota bacterium]
MPCTHAMAQTQVAICISDPNAEDCPIVFANQAFCDLTGYDRSQVIGRNCGFPRGPETAGCSGPYVCQPQNFPPAQPTCCPGFVPGYACPWVVAGRSCGGFLLRFDLHTAHPPTTMRTFSFRTAGGRQPGSETQTLTLASIQLQKTLPKLLKLRLPASVWPSR